LDGSIRAHVVPNNIFRLLQDKYYTAAFTQNLYADKLLFQFDQYLDRHQAIDSFNFSVIRSTTTCPVKKPSPDLEVLIGFCSGVIPHVDRF
jgi:hypothetical protein